MDQDKTRSLKIDITVITVEKLSIPSWLPRITLASRWPVLLCYNAVESVVRVQRNISKTLGDPQLRPRTEHVSPTYLAIDEERTYIVVFCD